VRIVLAGLGALVLALLVANAVALWSLPRAPRQTGTERKLAGEHSTPERLKQELDELKSAMSTMEEANKEKLRRAEERQKELEAKLQETEGDSKGARETRKKAEEKLRWFQSEYYSVSNHKWHPDDKPTETPTAEVEPVKRPQPPPPGGMQLLPLLPLDKAQGFKRMPVGPDDKTKPGRSRACFPPARCDGLLEPPKLLDGLLTFRGDGKDVIVQHKMLRGLGNVDILRCSVDPEEPFLVLEAMGKEAVGDYAPYVQHLVLETASLRDRVVYQYHRPRDPEKRQLVLPQGRAAPASRVEQDLAYPWPDSLSLRYARLGDGKPFPLFPGTGHAGNPEGELKSDDAETRCGLGVGGRKSRQVVIKKKHHPNAAKTLDFALQFDLVGGGTPATYRVKVALSVPGAAFRAYLDGLLNPGNKRLPGELGGRWDQLQSERNKLEAEKRKLEDELTVLRRKEDAKKNEKDAAAREGLRELSVVDKARDYLARLDPGQLEAEIRRLENAIKAQEESLRSLAKQHDQATRQEDRKTLLQDAQDTKRLMERNRIAMARKIRDKKLCEESKPQAEVKLKAAEAEAAPIRKRIAALDEALYGLQSQEGKTASAIKLKESEIAKKQDEIQDEPNRLARSLVELFGDLGSVEILDPWGRTLWVIELRLEWDKN
jgi:hypothetical protein